MAAADETEEIVDLEAFHQELLNSVNNVRRMVVSWLPPSSDLERFKEYDDTNVNLDSLRTRPDRLGLGAKPSASKTSAVALANPNSAEGRIIRTLLGGSQKRKAVEEPETPRASTSVTQNNGKLISNGVGTANDSEDEEDSRANAISSKGKKKADFFHDKPSKQSHQSNGLANGQSTSKKNKKKKQEVEAQAAEVDSAVAGDTFVKPATPNGTKPRETPSAPVSPSRMNGHSSHRQQDKPDEEDGEQDDDESSMTETTMTGTLQGSPTPGEGQPVKRKRKNKKKKSKNPQGPNGSASAPTTSAPAAKTNGMLFGESILD